MQSIEKLRIEIEQEILGLKYPSQPKELYAPIDYILSLGGKRMRPILLLLAHQLFDGDLKKALKPSLAIEAFHNFTLVHDDIMDNAPLRRGKLTVHEKWNPNIAILSGDALLIQSYQFFSDLEPEIYKEVLEIFSKTALEVCEGQQFDMDFELQAEVSMDSYLKMIEYKTAVLLAASLKIGAIIAKASPEQADLLYSFGRDIGIAFQLKDDLLDAFGDQSKFGKKLGGDIIANKKTCLYLQTLEKADKKTKMELVNLYSSNDLDDVTKIERTKEIFEKLNIQDLTSQLIDHYYSKAMKSLSLVEGDKRELLNFADLLKSREN
ncbi:MAG: polyprenyl synthetase family protein [Flavobacteriales bacterium]